MINYSQQQIEVGMLLSCIRENKLSKSDKKFLLENLTLEKRALLEKSINDENLKTKKEKQKKHEKKLLLKPYMITIFNQPMLLSEFLIVLSRQYKNSSIAVLESDRLNPQLDIFLNSDRNIKGIYTHLDISRTTSLNLLIDALHKKNLTKQYVDNLSTKVNGYKNISFFTGSYLLGDYEYYHIEDYKNILDFLRSQYDILLISTNQFIYDAFTCMSLMESDLNLIGIKGSMPNFMEAKRYFDFLEEKQNIAASKNFYLLFDYNRKRHIHESVVKQYVRKNYVGNISENNERQMGIHRHYSYMNHLSKKNINQYQQIINKLMQRL